jgi:type IV pilus assembly protein PilV
VKIQHLVTNLDTENGFTLVEILVAMTVFAIGMLAIAGLQVSAIKSNMTSNIRGSLSAVTSSAAEQILALDTETTLFQTSGTYTIDLDSESDETSITLDAGGTYTATAETSVNTPTSGTTQITITVDGPLERSQTIRIFRSTK